MRKLFKVKGVRGSSSFPAPAFDQGYDVLLSRTDLFDDTVNAIAKYIY